MTASGRWGLSASTLAHIRGKISEIERAEAALRSLERATAEPTGRSDGRIEACPGDDRLRIHFDSVPDAEARERLKRLGLPVVASGGEHGNGKLVRRPGAAARRLAESIDTTATAASQATATPLRPCSFVPTGLESRHSGMGAPAPLTCASPCKTP